MKKVFIFLIRIYQRTISPDQGILRHLYPSANMHCVMYPTCSEYMVLSIEKFGVTKGILKGLKRISRCNPSQKVLIDIP